MKYKIIPLFLAIALFTGCGQSTEPQQSSSVSESATQETKEEPYILTFEAVTIEGEEITSSCFADSKLSMLNVWATYCNPCLSEMPDLGEIAAEYDTSVFQMYGIISDVMENDTSEKIEEARTLIKETKADYPHLLLNQSLYSNLVGAVSGVPTTFFINQDGELLGYLVGAQTKDTWITIIEDLLSQMEQENET